MSQTVPQPTGPQNRPADRRQVLIGWMEKSQQITARWLYELGGWVFGGLIVAALMLLQSLIGLGFAERAVLISGLALAIALPFNLTGLGVVRYFRDLNQASEEAKQSLAQNTSGDDDETLARLAGSNELFTQAKRRVMDSTVALALAVSLLFTLIGIGSALWRISWAVTVLFLIASVLGLLLLLRVIRYSA